MNRMKTTAKERAADTRCVYQWKQGVACNMSGAFLNPKTGEHYCMQHAVLVRRFRKLKPIS
jgi:hypothetical protein